MRIIEYFIVYCDEERTIAFAEQVTAMIKNGWQPFGTPFVYNDIINQALVRYENSN